MSKLAMRRRRTLGCVIFCLAVALSAAAAEKPRIRVDDYAISAELVPLSHKLLAHARVKFTALDDISIATFELHNALRVTRVTDASGRTLNAERVTQDSTVRVALPDGLSKGASTSLTFDYEGVLQSADESPVEGLKLAYIGDDTSYLLYAGRWFPMVGYNTNRFTASMAITVPAGMTVIGTGRTTSAPAELPSAPAPAATPGRPGRVGLRSPAASAASSQGKNTHYFLWDKPSFPGTIIAGRFDETTVTQGGMNVRVYFKPSHKAMAKPYGETAGKEFEYFSSIYGPAVSYNLYVVELPDDTVPTAWAPEIAGLASRGIQEKINYRLLANAVARQWWGVRVSPARQEDAWISDGFARYSEARYVEWAAGQAAFEEVMKDIAVGALAYDNIPLAGVGRLSAFSPEFQSLVTDKGAMILHMLRWIVGDKPFDQILRNFATQFNEKSATVDDFRKVAEFSYGQSLQAFFSQWLDSTGAPEFHNKYTVFRTAKGFRVVGEVSQDLDLFRMPVELRIDTDGKTETKRIEVVGTNSPYVVETFGKPRHISLDPGSHVLKNSSDFKVRVSILRGTQLVAQGDLAEALREYQKALDINKNSSLAHYRIAEVFFLQRNYQAAANAYREAANGDNEPRWTEVWSYIQLGKIFDLTGQRERAVNEYRRALNTNDNTQGALEEARKYLQTPYSKQSEGQS
ncbi:MAG TPA: M1 family aminopeptidase [Terriglobales bacterium]|nr:M1 family aminopeptidase [Terriglobales bacterium]